MTTDELIAAARRAGACEKALRWARSPEASWETLPPDWACWLRTHCTLDDAAKRLAEEAACRSPRCAYRLRIWCRDLDDDARRRAEEAACRDPEEAARLRTHCHDLDRAAKRRAEEAACRDPEAACRIYIGCTDLDDEVKSRVKEAAMRSLLW